MYVVTKLETHIPPSLYALAILKMQNKKDFEKKHLFFLTTTVFFLLVDKLCL